MPKNRDEKPNKAKSSVLYELIRILMLSWFRLSGWKTTGEIPSEPKFVAIGAPHTSNWDFFVMLAIALDWRINLRWLGKDSIFRVPFQPVCAAALECEI
jgi:1-acyl-sn-glycerol-3-phosphate acyltransferase